MSELFAYCTARSATCHWARVAVPPADVSVITPVPALYAPAMLPIVAGTFVKASVSCPEAKFAVIDTVPDTCVGLSRSASVSTVLIAAAAPFSV